MKFKSKKTNKEVEISTASLPDIVFLLLFFFMVSATIRPKEEMLEMKVPQAETIAKVERRELIRELNVGVPRNPAYGSEPRVSTITSFLDIEDVAQWALGEKETLPEALKDQMIVLIKADERVNMGLINDIQQELRKSNTRKVVYRTLEK
ncbi:MAG: biopolymer transporter ExbD [Cyclobacteriaceae bacterium]